MRKRELIEKDGARVDLLTLEVLLDIRELLARQAIIRTRKARKVSVKK